MKKSYSKQGYCILNAEGDLWTPEYFLTEHLAKRYISRAAKSHGWNLSQHTVVKASFTVRPKREG